MTILVPPIQSFEAFEATTVEMLKPPFRSKFGAVAFGDMVTDDGKPAYEYAVKGIIPRHENVLIYGASQSGKSFFTSDLALSVSREVDFFGQKTKQGLVIYCAAEAGRGFARLRMPAYRKYHSIDEPVPFVCLTKKFDLYGDKDTTPQLIAEVNEIAAQYDVPLEAIVIDTLNKATPGMDEISGKDVGIVVERLERIQKECGAGIWLVHHKNGAGTAPRGHTSLFAGFETSIEIVRLNEKDADGRPVRLAKVAKQREGEDGGMFKFVLKQVQIGRDEDGDPVTSCVVERPAGGDGQAASPVGFKPSPGDALFIKALATAVEEHGVAPPLDLGLPQAIQRVVDYKHVKTIYRDQNPDDGNDDAKWRERLKKSLQRGRERLQGYHIIGTIAGKDGQWIWRTGRAVKGFGKGQVEASSSTPYELPTDAIGDNGDIQL